MDVAYINPFILAISEVFESMVRVPCVVGKPFLKRPTDRLDHLFQVAATITLSGPTSGMIALNMSKSLAVSLAGALAGEPFPGLNDHCRDALLETVNMVAGAAKKRFPGGQVTLSMPALRRTQDVAFPAALPVVIIPFDTGRGRFIIEVALRGPKPLPQE